MAILYRDRRITYREVYECVNRAGNALLELGLQPERRVMLILPDCPEFAYAFFGAIKIGCVAVPVNTVMQPSEYAFLLNDSRARAVVVHESLVDRIESVRSSLKHLRHVLVAGKARPGQLSFDDLLAKASTELEPADTHRDEPALWLYTSGSTGAPKAAVHLQHDMIYMSDLLAIPCFGIRESDINFSASKLFFAYGLGNGLYFPFRVGSTTVLNPDRADPERLLEMIQQYRATVFCTVATLYARILAIPDVERRYDLSSLRLCLSSGEPLPVVLFQRWKEKFGLELLDVMGTTEALHDFLTSVPGNVKPGSCGVVTPAFEAKIVDDEGKELGPGIVGHLLVKGDSCAAFYWNRHEQTKRTMQGEWLRTGDMLYKDPEGYFWYCGRSDDMLRVAGQWVSPFKVESALLEHQAVLEAAVAAAQDPQGLTYPKAWVVLRDEFRSEGGPQTEEIREFLRSRLLPHERPREILVVDQLPKTATGKIQRFRLRKGEA